MASMQSYEYNTAPSIGKERAIDNRSTSPQPFKPYQIPQKSTNERPRISHQTFRDPGAALAASHTAPNLVAIQRRVGGADHSSATWTSSSGDINLVSENEELDHREKFVDEYNRLAKKYGIRPIIPRDFPVTATNPIKSLPNRKSSWVSKVLRQSSAGQPIPTSAPKTSTIRHRRSISELALSLVSSQRKEGLKDQDLRGLVRLCGKCMFYLPAEYAPGSLVLPTCLRATAQHLVQHAGTRGIFRVPGSVRTINALYDYYCADKNDDDIATTTRCPRLPAHLNCGVHDVASTFKRLLDGLPGGILGSLALFDALVAIYYQLHGDVESTRTKETKLRARLIALAIRTVKSRYQRELICAVFGLLCLVGRTAENTPREDEAGRPLQTSDLTGYGSLAILFGPLLVGDLIDSYSMKVADPSAGLVLWPLTPPKCRRQRKSKTARQQISTQIKVDKILVANDITEMLIVHWRDIVRHLRSIDALRRNRATTLSEQRDTRDDRQSSVSELFSINIPQVQSTKQSSTQHNKRHIPPPATSPTLSSRLNTSKTRVKPEGRQFLNLVNSRRSDSSSPASLHTLPQGQPTNAHSPAVEENTLNEIGDIYRQDSRAGPFKSVLHEPGSKDQFHTYLTKNAGQPKCADHVRQRPQLSSRSELLSNQKSSLRRSSRDNGNETSSSGILDKTFMISLEALDQRAPSSSNAKKEYSRSNVGLESNSTEEASETFVEGSIAKHVPLNDGRQSISRSSKRACGLALSENDSARHRSSTAKSQKSIDSWCINVNKNTQHFHNQIQITLEPTNEGDSEFRSSGAEKFPSFTDAIIEPTTASQNTDTSNYILMEAKSSTSPPRQFVEKKSPQLEKKILREEHENYFGTTPSKTSPATMWEKLAKHYHPSTPSLRQKRIDSGSKTQSARKSEELLFTGNKKPPTSEWKREVENEKREERKPNSLSPEKIIVFNESLRSTTLQSKVSPTKSEFVSPAKALTDSGGYLPPRPTSKPVGGAVKAMAALFDTASKHTPPGHKPPFTDRCRRDLGDSKSLGSSSIEVETPAGSVKLPVVPTIITPPRTSQSETAGIYLTLSDTSKRAVHNSINRITTQGLKSYSARAALHNTPTRQPKLDLRTTCNPLSAARNEPHILQVPGRDRELTHAPSLGTMVPHHEEPPVAQHLNFARPLSATSSHGRITQHGSSDNTLQAEDIIHFSIPAGGQRPGSGNSLLHAQIRSLQRQLDLRNEELVQLRRQLETVSNIDVGTLSEQLRVSNRECKMWRERAEAAEKRIVVFERFTSRIKALRGGPDATIKTIQKNTGPAGRQRAASGSSSSCTDHTDNQEAVNKMMRTATKRRVGMGGDGVGYFEIGNDELYHETTLGRDLEQGGISGATAQNMVAAEEFLIEQRGMEDWGYVSE